MLNGSNYTADDSTYPTRIEFADGRMIAIKTENGKVFLGVGRVEPREEFEKSYDDLITGISAAPITQLPGLLRHVLFTSIEKKCWQPGGLLRFIKNLLGSGFFKNGNL